MEEDITNNAEFPENGMFNLGQVPSSKYKVCGESSEQIDNSSEPSRPRFTFRSPVPGATSGWGQPRPWAGDNSNDPGPSNPLPRKKPRYENYFKRTIPYVSMSTGGNGKSICVDTIISNVYVRLADDNVTPQAILTDISSKITIDVEELVLLDAKFVPLIMIKVCG